MVMGSDVVMIVKIFNLPEENEQEHGEECYGKTVSFHGLDNRNDRLS